MINIHTLDNRTKAAIVCFYYAQLPSKDIRYKNKCHETLKFIATAFSYKYGNLKNDKDAFDGLYPNRSGWNDRPLEKRSSYLYNIYLEYKDIHIDELEQAVMKIIEEAQTNETPYFSIKTKDSGTVKKILSKNTNVEFDGLNILKEHLKIGQLVFIVFGGDKPAWDTGLVGMGIISKEPYDIGYLKNNYRISVDIKLLLDKPIKREDLIPYRDTYGIIGIGPIVKWEPNQAISQVTDKNAIALMHAMLELSPSIEEDLNIIVPSNVFERVKGATTKMMPIEVDFGEKLPNELAITDESVPEEQVFAPYTKEDFLKDVFIDAESYNNIVGLLEYKKNIILEGAPGVGKTFTAKRLAYSILGEKNSDLVKMIQFHQNYSYEDFIMGFRPNESGFELSEGPFYKFCLNARGNSHKNFFIIDEINRGNLSKIFGELLMLIEADKRSEKISILYKNEEFGIPENVYIIGMMNTADRSLAIIDYALRRRFSFYPMSPAFNSEGFQLIIDSAAETNIKNVIKVITALNKDICKDDSLGAGFQIGHSYFCSLDEITNERLKLVIEYELIPLLKEYWFDETEKVEHWTEKLRGTLND